MITHEHAYALVGLFIAAASILSIFDRANPRRVLNFLFWGLLATSFLAGSFIGDLGNAWDLTKSSILPASALWRIAR